MAHAWMEGVDQPGQEHILTGLYYTALYFYWAPRSSQSHIPTGIGRLSRAARRRQHYLYMSPMVIS
jgi:hypothetical protein